MEDRHFTPGKQRKKYRIATVVLAIILAVSVAAAVFLSIQSVSNYLYLTERRKQVDLIDEVGGFNAVSEKIAQMTAKATELETQQMKKQTEQQSAETQNNDIKQQYDDISAENTVLQQQNFEAKIAALQESYDELKEKHDALQEDYDKLVGAETTPPDDAPSDGDKIAYLTFDDGLSGYTSKILDILDQNNAKATFFVNGCNGHYDLYSRIVNEGHTLGNHTYSHEWSSVYKNPSSFREEVTRVNNLIKEKTGVTPTIFRFPGGSSTTKCGNELRTDSEWQNTSSQPHKMMFAAMDVLDELGMKYFDWNVSSGDASGVEYTTKQLVSNVLRDAGSKKTIVVLMHEKKMTVNALSEIIKALKEKGYSFKALTSSSPTCHFLNR